MSAVPRTGLSRYAYQGRHRTPETPGTAVRSAALSAGVVAAVLAGSAAPATAATTTDPWSRLRMCESGGDYAINTGNGYYGAYQFDAGTWHAYGGSGLPHQASRDEQDYRAKLLYRARGWAPWPGCSRRLGLREDPSYGATGTAPHPATAPGTARHPTRPHRVTVSGPAAARLLAVYRITGTSRANSRITVRIRAAGKGTWRAYPKRTDARGRFSVPWRARTDYRYQVVGETRSAIRGTKVATTAEATGSPTVRWTAGGAAPEVTASGTARPSSKMILFVRPARGKWRTWAKFATNSTGSWTLELPAPSRGFQYYAKSANGLRSRIRSLTV